MILQYNTYSKPSIPAAFVICPLVLTKENTHVIYYERGVVRHRFMCIIILFRCWTDRWKECNVSKGNGRPFQEIFNTRVAKCMCKCCWACDGVRSVFSFFEDFITLIKGIVCTSIVFKKRPLFLDLTY